MKTKTLYIGIMSREEYQKRTINIAKGVYKPKPHEPTIWFESMKLLAQILSNENQALLRLIAENKPRSISELEALSGRKKSNLSRTLKTLARYGIVELERAKQTVIPKVQATDFRVEFGFGSVAAIA